MTKEENRFQQAVRRLGCIACRLDGHPGTPAEIHHLLSGGRRRGEMHVLGLCAAHHRGGYRDGQFVSRHPYRARFEAKFGSEEVLLKKTRELVAALDQRRAA